MATENREQSKREQYGLDDASIFERIADHWIDYLFVILPMAAFAVMFYYPILRGLYITLLDYNLGGASTWVGLGNYVWLVTNDLFWQAFEWTIVFVGATTFLQIVTGLTLALLVNELTSGWREWTTAIIMSPYFCASLVGGIVWKWFVNPEYGVMGRLFGSFGMNSINFLAQGWWPYIVLIVAQTWHDFAYAGLIYVAALKSIPTSQYEAAAIDGANRFQRFRDVTLPHLMIPTVIVLAIRTAWNLSEFAQPFALTAGGPGDKTYLLSILVYDVAFTNFRFGRAYTVGIVMLVISVGMALIYIRFIRQEDELYV